MWVAYTMAYRSRPAASVGKPPRAELESTRDANQIVRRNHNKPLHCFSVSDTLIHPLNPVSIPGISVATDSKTFPTTKSPSGAPAEGHDIVSSRAALRCPTYLFRAQSFCARQQQLVDALRDKFERYRKEVEATRRIEKLKDCKEVIVDNRPKKKWMTKVHDAGENSSDVEFHSDDVGNGLRTITDAPAKPQPALKKSQGDIPRAWTTQEKVIFPNQAESCPDEPVKKQQTTTRKTVDNTVNEVPGFNARLDLFI